MEFHTEFLLFWIRRQQDEVSRLNRVECAIVGPVNFQGQEPFAERFEAQIFSLLRAENFSIAGTEVDTGKVNTRKHQYMFEYNFVYLKDYL